jgi:hypothetical protein
MASIRLVIINLLIVSLFAVAIITGGSMLAVQNGANQSITDDQSLSNIKANLSTGINSNYEKTKSASTSFENSSISLTGGIPFIDSIYGTWKVLKETPVMMYNLIFGGIFEKVLGSNSAQIILAVIGTILTITIIFAVVKLISTGDGG